MKGSVLIVNLLLVFFAVFMTYGLGSVLPFNIFLVFVVLVTFLYRVRVGFLWAVISGLLANGFTLVGHGVYMISLILMVFFVNLFLNAWFPARSVTSAFVIAAVGTFIFEIISRFLSAFLFLVKFIPFLPVFDKASALAVFYNIIGVTVAVTLLSFVARKTSSHVKGAFLIR